MLINRLHDIKCTEREVRSTSNNNWVSYRLLLKKDGMGFSFHDTRIFAGSETHIHYKNHLEAVYCVEGKGEIELIETGEKFKIENGTMYALNKHDNHYLRAKEDMRLICVFNPPLVDNETHDEHGVYSSKQKIIHTYLD